MSANEELNKKVSLFCVYIECDDRRISAAMLTKNYAVTSLHCIPDTLRKIGSSVIICDAHGQHHNAYIHGLNNISDYVVFKKADGVFDNVPEITYPSVYDQYIVGFSSGEKKPSLRLGRISSISTGSQEFLQGDSGRLPGFTGGGVFYARSGALMGIARGSNWKEYKKFSYVLDMVSIQVILSHIELFSHQPFSV